MGWNPHCQEMITASSSHLSASASCIEPPEGSPGNTRNWIPGAYWWRLANKQCHHGAECVGAKEEIILDLAKDQHEDLKPDHIGEWMYAFHINAQWIPTHRNSSILCKLASCKILPGLMERRTLNCWSWDGMDHPLVPEAGGGLETLGRLCGCFNRFSLICILASLNVAQT